MWSPSFVPKCPDWPPHVDVVGEFRKIEETKDNHAETVSSASPVFIISVSKPSVYSSLLRPTHLIRIFRNSWTIQLEKVCYIRTSHIFLEASRLYSTVYAPKLNIVTIGQGKPVYVGFGSMVIEDGDALVQIIKVFTATAN